MRYHLFIGFLPICLFIGSCALEYSVLESLETTCLPRDSCVLSYRASFTNRSCECDDFCNDFRDCCIDKASLAPTGTRKYFCMAFGKENQDGAYVVDTCPEDQDVSSEIQNLCQGEDFADPLVSTPVTFISEATTYKNRYCAECNGVSPSSLVLWTVYLNCETLIPYQLNDSYIRQNIQFNPGQKGWGVEFGDKFHRCDIIFDKPSDLTAVRLCRANTIDSCPSSYRRASVRRLCESYSAVVHDAETSYKNPHCAICNNKRINDLTCLNSASFMRHAKIPFSFGPFIDLTPRGEFRELGNCTTREIYDPFFKRCRKIECRLPGYKLENGKCQKQ